MTVSGCGNINSAIKHQTNEGQFATRNGSGILYGTANPQVIPIKQACDAINNSDPRCLEQSKYKILVVTSGYGYSRGFIGSTALVDKDLNLHTCKQPAWEKCTYVKLQLEKGKLGTYVGVVSEIGDEKCEWSGLNGVGGTVCKAFNWDYSKDMK